MNNIFYNLLSNNNLVSGINKLSSIFTRLLTDANTVKQKITFTTMLTEKVITPVAAFLYKVIYFIAKFILLAVDVIYAYITKLCGLDMDYTSLDSLFSTESDIVFNMLFTSMNIIMPIIKNLLGLAIALIIVFTIIAIIKSQFDNVGKAQKGKDDGKIMETIKKTIKAFFLLMLMPMMALVGIVFSNLLLQSLYRATNLSGSLSIASRIFSTSAVSASTYRTYAENNRKIPVSFDVGDAEEALKYFQNHPVNSVYAEYLKSSDNNPIYATYMMFSNETYFTFEQLNDVLGTQQEGSYEAYNGMYDCYKGGDVATLLPFRHLSNYREEYYVMADIIDYSINHGTKFYFVTIEEMLNNVLKIFSINDLVEIRNKIFLDYIIKYDIQLYKVDDYTDTEDLNSNDLVFRYNYGSDAVNPSVEDIIDIYQNGKWNILSYNTNYLGVVGGTEPSAKMEINKKHIRGEVDELKGAKFIVATLNEMVTQIDDITYLCSYFEPLTVGYTGGNEIEFSSEYILRGQLITAKGTFKNSKYPTAIRKNGETEIQFYRYDIETQSNEGIDNLMKVGFNPPKGIFGFLKAIFKPETIEVDYALNLQNLESPLEYKQEEVIYSKVKGGGIQVGYYFEKYSSSNKNKVVNTEYITLDALFVPNKMNAILLLIAPLLLFKCLVSAFFGVIQRGYELFLMIIVYPTVVVSIPLDDQAYTTWWRKYFDKLFLTYGLILGINFVLLLFPIIEKIEYFSPEDVAQSKPINRICRVILFGNLPVMQITSLLNITTGILFQLAAFTLFETIPAAIGQIVSADSDGTLKSSAVETFSKILKGFATVGKAIGKTAVFALKTAIKPVGTVVDAFKGINNAEKKTKNIRKFKEGMKKLLPGSKVIDEIQTRKYASDMKKKAKEAEQNVKNELSKTNINKPDKDPEDPDLSPEQREDAKKQQELYKKQVESMENALKAEKSALEAEKQAIGNPEAYKNAKDGKTQKKIEEKRNLIDGDVKSQIDEENQDKENEKNGDKSKSSDDEGDGDGEEKEEKSTYEQGLSYKTDRELDKEERHLDDRIKQLEEKKNRIGAKRILPWNWKKEGDNLTDDEKRALEIYKERKEKIQEERKSREDYNSEENAGQRQKDQEELDNLKKSGLVAPQAPKEPVKPEAPVEPTKPADDAPQAEKDKYAADMQKYNEDKKKYDADMQKYNEDKTKYDADKAKYDEDKRNYDESQKRIKELDLKLNRDEKIKEHREEQKRQEKEERRQERVQKEGKKGFLGIGRQKSLDQIQKEDMELFNSGKATPGQIERRLKQIQKRSTELNDMISKKSGYNAETLMYMPAEELEKLGLKDDVKDMLQEYKMYNAVSAKRDAEGKPIMDANGNKIYQNYSDRMMEMQERQIRMKVQYETNQEKKKENSNIPRTKRGKKRREDRIESLNGADAENKLKEKREELAKLEETRRSNPADQKKYLEVYREVQQLEQKRQMGNELSQIKPETVKAMNKLQREEKNRREAMEKAAVEVLGDSASEAEIRRYCQNQERRERQEEEEILKSGSSGRKKKILDRVANEQKAYEDVCKQIFDENNDDGKKLEDLLKMNSQELDTFLRKRTRNTTEGKKYSNDEKEMIRKYIELTRKMQRYNELNENGE